MSIYPLYVYTMFIFMIIIWTIILLRQETGKNFY